MNEVSHTEAMIEQGQEEGIHPLELLRVIVRRRVLIIKICTLAVVLSSCYVLNLKNIYTATSIILPPPREFGVGGIGLGSGGGAGALLAAGQNAYLELYISICKSRSVIDAVVKRLDLLKVYKTNNSEMVHRAVKGSLTFQPGKDGTIVISAKSKDPQLAAQLANTVVDEMARRSAQLYITKAGTERYFLEKRLREVKNELSAAEEKLKIFQEKHKAIRADAQATLAIEGIAKLKLEIVNKEVQLATLRNSMTDESSEVRALQAAISKLKGQLGAMTGSGGSDSIVPVTGNVPEIVLEFTRLLRETKTLESVFEQLSKQYELAKVNESRDESTVQVIDEAVVPTKKSGPKRSLIVMLATFTAFLVSLVIVFIKESFSRLSPEDAEIVREIKQSLRFWKREAWR